MGIGVDQMERIAKKLKHQGRSQDFFRGCGK